MASLPEPKPKPSKRWTKLGPRFPIFDDTCGIRYCQTVITAFYENGTVWVEDKYGMEDLYFKGYFGKGSLSRGAPAYAKTQDIYSSSTYEFEHAVNLRPFPPSQDPQESNQEDPFQEEREVEEEKKNEDLGGWNDEDPGEWDEKCTSEAATVDQEKKDESFQEHIEIDQDDHEVGNDSLRLCADISVDSNSDVEEEACEVEVEETLELMLEEAFFLNYCFGCLELKDTATNHVLSCSEMWKLFSKVDERFAKRYVAYHYYRSKGWIVRSGLIFGGDFALYKDGPPHYHSTFVVLVKDGEEPGIPWIQMSALVRVAEKMSKVVIICEVVKKGNASYDFEHFANCQVRELMMKRWAPSKQRQEVSEEDMLC